MTLNKKRVKNPLTARQFLEGLRKIRTEDLRLKWHIPPDLDIDLLVAILKFMEEDEARRRRKILEGYRHLVNIE